MRDVGIVSFAQSNARREVRNEVEILLPVVKEAVKQSGLARTDIDFTCSGSSEASGVPEAPWPGRSGATTRWVRVSGEITRSQCAANSPGPCSRTTGGPSPPTSTEVGIPASRSRCSVAGSPASNRSRASIDPPFLSRKELKATVRRTDPGRRRPD